MGFSGSPSITYAHAEVWNDYRKEMREEDYGLRDAGEYRAVTTKLRPVRSRATWATR